MGVTSARPRGDTNTKSSLATAEPEEYRNLGWAGRFPANTLGPLTLRRCLLIIT
jgi:hypothetical protein